MTLNGRNINIVLCVVYGIIAILASVQAALTVFTTQDADTIASAISGYATITIISGLSAGVCMHKMYKNIEVL
jgi:hypothetical protein